MYLVYLILLPLVTAILVLLSRNATQVKVTALGGAVAQLILSFILFAAYRHEVVSGNDSTNVV